MWGIFGQEADAKASKSAKSLREENEALKRELDALRQKGKVGGGGAISASPSKGSPAKKTSPPKPSPQKAVPAGMRPAADVFNGALEPAIKAGDIVYVTGLNNKPEFNGRLARILTHDPTKGTWSVFIEGETKKHALKPDNLRVPKTPITTFSPSSNLIHDASSPSKTARKGQTSRGGSPVRKLTVEEREAVQSRLLRPTHASPPRQKAPRTDRAKEAAASLAHLKDPFDDQAGPRGLDERPPFMVPHGKRRVHNAPGRTSRAEKTDREKPTTQRGSPTTWAALNRQAWEGRTTSPTGRGHPNQFRRNDLRSADMHTNINYYATVRVANKVATTGDAVYSAPDNDRKNKEASWLASQAWFEGLRHYPKGPDAMDSEAAYSGLTHGGGEEAMPTEHLETDLRTRLGIAVADPDWRPAQLQEAWAPENPRLAKRLNDLASKLRGVPKDHTDVAPAGHFNGPDLWA